MGPGHRTVAVAIAISDSDADRDTDSDSDGNADADSNTDADRNSDTGSERDTDTYTIGITNAGLLYLGPVSGYRQLHLFTYTISARERTVQKPLDREEL